MIIKPQLFGNWNGHFLKWTVLFLGLTNRLTCSILECIFRNGHSYSVPEKIWDLLWMELLICTYSLWNYDCKNLHVYFGPLHQSLGLHIFQIGSKATTEIKQKRAQEFLLNISDTFTPSYGKTGPHFEDILLVMWEFWIIIIVDSEFCWNPTCPAISQLLACGKFGSSYLKFLIFSEIKKVITKNKMVKGGKGLIER